MKKKDKQIFLDSVGWPEDVKQRVLGMWSSPGKSRVSAADVAALPLVTDEKMVGVLEFLDEGQKRLFACHCAEDALLLVKNPDPSIVEAVRVARLFAEGGCDRDVLEKAWDDVSRVRKAIDAANDYPRDKEDSSLIPYVCETWVLREAVWSAFWACAPSMTMFEDISTLDALWASRAARWAAHWENIHAKKWEIRDQVMDQCAQLQLAEAVSMTTD